MEEERRLAYVAVTRAKEKLYILHSSERLLYGRTQNNELSRFAEEIPKELIQSSIPKRGKRLQENFEFRKTRRESENSFIIDEFEKRHSDLITIRLLVSKGTYIRSLIQDICKKLNTIGIMSELVRTKEGILS